MRNSRLFAAHGLKIENAVHLDTKSTHLPTTTLRTSHSLDSLASYIHLHLCTCAIQLFPITIWWWGVILVGYSKGLILGASAPKRSELISVTPILAPASVRAPIFSVSVFNRYLLIWLWHTGTN